MASETLSSRGSCLSCCCCCSPSRRRPLRRGAERPPGPSTTKPPARTCSGRTRNPRRRRSCWRNRSRIRTGVESAAGASAIETSCSAAAAAICPSAWESKSAAAARRRSPGTASVAATFSAVTATFACRAAAAVWETSLRFGRTWEAGAALRGLPRNSQEMAAVPGTDPAAAAATPGGAWAAEGGEG